MNDCIWFWISACDGEQSCKDCTHYVSANSEDGSRITEEWGKEVEAALTPIRADFAKRYGFQEERNE